MNGSKQTQKEEAHRNKTVRLFFIYFFILGRFRLRAGACSTLQASALPVHILYNDVIDLADRGAVLQDQPRLVGMEVDLDRISVSTYCQQAVALEVLDNIIKNLIFIKIIAIDQKLCITKSSCQASLSSLIGISLGTGLRLRIAINSSPVMVSRKYRCSASSSIFCLFSCRIRSAF